ncbi:hypothetical protein JOL62DRAFT_617245, partial [Phyllosticta paracitricarpa]
SIFPLPPSPPPSIYKFSFSLCLQLRHLSYLLSHTHLSSLPLPLSCLEMSTRDHQQKNEQAGGAQPHSSSSRARWRPQGSAPHNQGWKPTRATVPAQASSPAANFWCDCQRPVGKKSGALAFGNDILGPVGKKSGSLASDKKSLDPVEPKSGALAFANDILGPVGKKLAALTFANDGLHLMGKSGENHLNNRRVNCVTKSAWLYPHVHVVPGGNFSS